MSELDKITRQRDDYLKRGHELKRDIVVANSYIVDLKKKLEVANTGYPYQSENVNEVFTAFAKAQGEFPKIPKDKEVKYSGTMYKYASLSAVFDYIIPVLSMNNLNLTQYITRTNVLHTRIAHSSGQFFESHYALPFPSQEEFTRENGKKNYMQGLGAIRTYCRRYEIYNILGIFPDEDTDGV